MATRHKDKHGNYIISYRNPITNKFTTKYLSKKLKIEEVNSIMNQLENKEIARKYRNFGIKRKEKKTIEELINDFKKYVYSRKGGAPLQKGSIDGFNCSINNIHKWLNHNNITELNNLSDELIFNLTSDCKILFNLQLSVIRKIQSTFKRFLKYALKKGYFDNYEIIDEMENIKESDIPKKEKYFTKEELKIFFSAKIDAEVYKMLAFTGLRISELCNLTWDNYNYDTNKLSFIGKDRKINRIELNETAKKVLLGQKGKHDTYIFPNTQGRKRIYKSTYDNLLNFANKNGLNKITEIGEHKKKINSVTPHIFRHTFASQLALKDVSIQKIMVLMRHKNIKETMIYAHLSNSDTLEASNKLNDLID